jgi:hypothetical protein
MLGSSPGMRALLTLGPLPFLLRVSLERLLISSLANALAALSRAELLANATYEELATAKCPATSEMTPCRPGPVILLAGFLMAPVAGTLRAFVHMGTGAGHVARARAPQRDGETRRDLKPWRIVLAD